MARAFGDKSLKQHLSSEPDIKVEIIDDDVEFAILASDGLWKVASFSNLCGFHKALHFRMKLIHYSYSCRTQLDKDASICYINHRSLSSCFCLISF